MANQNTQAVALANQIIALSQQLLSIYQQMVAIDAAWSDVGAAATIAAMATTATNPDGTIAAIDGTANVAHPINATQYGLSRNVSSTQIGQAKTIMDGIVNYVSGQAVSTQAGARAILNAVNG